MFNEAFKCRLSSLGAPGEWTEQPRPGPSRPPPMSILHVARVCPFQMHSQVRGRLHRTGVAGTLICSL